MNPCALWFARFWISQSEVRILPPQPIRPPSFGEVRIADLSNAHLRRSIERGRQRLRLFERRVVGVPPDHLGILQPPSAAMSKIVIPLRGLLAPQ